MTLQSVNNCDVFESTKINSVNSVNFKVEMLKRIILNKIYNSLWSKERERISLFHLKTRKANKNSEILLISNFGPFTHISILHCFYVIKPNVVIYSVHFTKIIKYVLTWQMGGILHNSISNTLGGSVCLKTFRSSCGCPHTKKALLRCSSPIQ